MLSLLLRQEGFFLHAPGFPNDVVSLCIKSFFAPPLPRVKDSGMLYGSEMCTPEVK